MSQRLVGPIFGLGSDGSKTVGNNENINSVVTRGSGSVGSRTLTVTSTTNFNIGDLIFIWKARGSTTTSPGKKEFNRIEAVGGGQFTLSIPLQNNYQNSGNDLTLVMLVPEYRSLTISSTNEILPNSWGPSGNLGGVVVFCCSGIATIGGSGIVAQGVGFVGASSERACGEGSEGPEGSPGSTSPNGNGGGGAADVSNASGGGGGHFAAGSNGDNSTGGYAVGDTALTDIFFGGGGGSGNDDGSSNGIHQGNDGGGVVIIIARKLVVTAAINVKGELYTGAQGPGNSGGGGGAAGGSILIVSEDADIGTDLLNASGEAGRDGPGSGGTGGAGAKGRIRIEVGKLTGSVPTASYGDVQTVKGGHRWTGDIGQLNG